MKEQSFEIIDSHQHFWMLSRGDYDWLTPGLKPLYHDFMPQDLTPIINMVGVSKTILVQAAPTLAETHFLLELADKHTFIQGVVGWVDMESKQASDFLTMLSHNRKFVGIRPMIQDIKDDRWMLKKTLQPAFNKLVQLKLSFDALVLPHHLKILLQFIEKYPDLMIIIDHAAKPKIKNNSFDCWANDIANIAKHGKVACKLSGLLTEAEINCPTEKLIPYMDHLFLCFGPERILWGSDWPVIKLVGDYKSWFNFCYDYVEKNFPNNLHDVFSASTLRCYFNI